LREGRHLDSRRRDDEERRWLLKDGVHASSDDRQTTVLCERP
jgi:hypothetical protein